jgi:integrase
MRGSTRKRGKTWTAYFDLPPKVDAETGTPVRRQGSKGGFERQKDAEAFLREKLGDADVGIVVEPSKVPLTTFMTKEWLPAIGGTVRPLTLRTYTSIVQQHITNRDIGGVPLCNLNAGHINAAYAQMAAEGYSPASIRLTHTVLHRALKDAMRWDKIRRNPATAADPPRQPETRAQAWTATETQRFLDHVEGDRLAPLWRLAVATGMRRGELLGVTWQGLDLESASLTVSQQVIGLKGGLAFGPPKSKRGFRTIALDAATVEVLVQHREVQEVEKAIAGPAYEDRDLVFCNELGAPINPKRLSEKFTAARKAAGLMVGTTHTLRHTHATLGLTAGIPLHVMARRIGDDPTTVLKTYAHLLPHSDSEAAETVAALLV